MSFQAIVGEAEDGMLSVGNMNGPLFAAVGFLLGEVERLSDALSARRGGRA